MGHFHTSHKFLTAGQRLVQLASVDVFLSLVACALWLLRFMNVTKAMAPAGPVSFRTGCCGSVDLALERRPVFRARFWPLSRYPDNYEFYFILGISLDP